jgi:hypothetical protein
MLLEFGGRSKRSEKNWWIKNSSKSMINIIFKNNTVIRILVIDLLNTILLLVFLMIKSVLKKLIVCLNNFSALFGLLWVEEVEKLCFITSDSRMTGELERSWREAVICLEGLSKIKNLM